MNKAVLLDRDGTLIRDVPYLGDPAKVALEDGVAGALRRLHELGYLLIVVTNQSGIGRGLFTEDDFQAVQARLAELLRDEGVPLRAVYHCPHHPTEARPPYLVDCPCRKPKSGMVLAAIAEHDLDPAQSFMIGDTFRDIRAGQGAGVRSILVRTGLGEESLRDHQGDATPDYVARNLLDAVAFITG